MNAKYSCLIVNICTAQAVSGLWYDLYESDIAFFYILAIK